MPLFSIITVCFNSSKTIERTIQSILNQQYKDYEYIIVDGKSTDETVKIIKKYESQFEGRLRWISESDKGIYDAFNKGCKLAKGNYLWIVNSDDWIESNALLKLSDIAQEHKSEKCIIAARMKFHLNNGEIKESPLITKERIELCAQNYYMGISHPATIYSKHVYEEIGLYDDRYLISGDLDHFIRCYTNGNIKFITINEFITNMSDGGISNQFNLKKVNHDWNIRYKKFCKNKIEYIKKMYISNYRYIKDYIHFIMKNDKN